MAVSGFGGAWNEPRAPRDHASSSAAPWMGDGRPGAIIRVDGLTKRYGAAVPALVDVSFSVDPGEFVAVLGPSGAGKTTLFRCLTGLTRPDAGSIIVRGHDICRIRGRALRTARHEIALIFQQFNLVRRLTAHHNVLAGRLATIPTWRVVARRFAKPDRQRALACLDAVGLLDRAYARADQLSGGQQQRVAIARAPGTGSDRHPGRRAGGQPRSGVGVRGTGDAPRRRAHRGGGRGQPPPGAPGHRVCRPDHRASCRPRRRRRPRRPARHTIAGADLRARRPGRESSVTEGAVRRRTAAAGRRRMGRRRPGLRRPHPPAPRRAWRRCAPGQVLRLVARGLGSARGSAGVVPAHRPHPPGR